MWRQRWDPGNGGGRHPTPWTPHCERETDSHKLIQHFNESSLHSVAVIHRSTLSFPYSLFSPPPSCAHATLFTPLQRSSLLKLQDVWKENFSCVAYLSLLPAHLHLIKTSEITHMSVWECEAELIFEEHMACILVTHFFINQCTLQEFRVLLDRYCWQKTD